MGSGVLLDPYSGGVEVYNASDDATDDVFDAMRADPVGSRVLAKMSHWANDIQRQSRSGGLFDRDQYVTPGNIFDQMKLAAKAAEDDDVVAGVLESTEALAFSRMSMYASDPDEEDVYNQIAAELDFDSRLREMWRELFTVSTATCGVYWGNRTYTVRGRSQQGVKRKKTFNLRVPLAVTVLDPLKVVPVGSTMFNREQLVYVADRVEADSINQVINGEMDDPIMRRMILGRYEPNASERAELSSLGLDSNYLFLLNPANVFRHTATRPQYKKFASVRMKSIFELLDLKHQLRQMDRTNLLAATNFIVLIKKGTDQFPAKPSEIANLQAQVRTVARVPVLVGDHRLNVEIVTPATDNTLKSDRYDTIDSRITARLYLMFLAGSTSKKADAPDKLVKVIARGMESRRHMLRRSLEANIWRPIFDANDSLKTPAQLRYHPKQIALEFDANFASFMLDLRESGEISRETTLSQFDFDQDDEAELIEREREIFDEIFLTTQPFDSPENNRRRGGGDTGDDGTEPEMGPARQRRVGRRRGGSAPGTGQGGQSS